MAGDTNDWADVFVRDRQVGSTERVSVRPEGAQADWSSLNPAISADGRFVAFFSEAYELAGWAGVFVRDRQSDGVERVSTGSDGTEVYGDSFSPAISADGRSISFVSDASNVVGGDTNNVFDVFLRDRHSGSLERVSVPSDGAQANARSGRAAAISADGRLVAFESDLDS